MNVQRLKNKLTKYLKFIYQNDATQGDALLLYATENLIAQQPFFLQRHSLNLDEFVNTTVDWLLRMDKDNSFLRRLAEFNINVANFQTVPSDYAQIIQAQTSARGVEGIEGARGGGAIINLESLEGIGGILFTPSEKQEVVTTTTKPSEVAAQKQNTATIIIIVIALVFLFAIIYFVSKK